MVREFAGLGEGNPRNPNGAILGMLRRTHWKDGDTTTLVDAIPNLSRSGRYYQRDLARILAFKEDYLAYWLQNADGYSPVDPVGVVVEGLTVRVDPEVGMETRIDQVRHPLKLWFSAGKISTRRAAVYHYLLREAATNSLWPVNRLPGIWHVRCRRILFVPTELPDGTEDMVLSAAEDFVERNRILTG